MCSCIWMRTGKPSRVQIGGKKVEEDLGKRTAVPDCEDGGGEGQDARVDEIIRMLDGKTSGGVSRISVGITDELDEGTVQEQYHHGRCDVGSPWATGKVRNFDC